MYKCEKMLFTVLIVLVCGAHYSEERPGVEDTTKGVDVVNATKESQIDYILQDVNVKSKTSPAVEKIIGGWTVEEGAVPYQVSVRDANSHICGGTILSKRKILTAAHCFAPLPEKRFFSFFIKAGSIALHSKTGQQIRIDNVIIHPDYSPSKSEHDIAIATLAEELVFSAAVQPIGLAKFPPAHGTNCTISGWGYTKPINRGLKPEERAPEILKEARVLVKNSSECAVNYTKINELYKIEEMICASSNDTDSCQGDSGGPLVCGNVLAGIVSWGYQCAHPDFPGVYTNVSYYRDWVLKTVNSASRLNTNINHYLLYFIFLYFIITFLFFQ